MAQSHWKIDAAHSSLQFSVRHLVIAKVRGAFKAYQGNLEFSEASPGAAAELRQVNVRVDAGSIDTGEAKRDEHLRGADFLDVERYPHFEFQSRTIERRGARYQINGDLTLHGITRPVVLEAELLGFGKDPWGNERVAFSGKARIERGDFGLTWNQALETGGVLVGTAIDIEVEVQALRVATAERSQARAAVSAVAV